MKIKTVTVIGANGTMGKNISAIFASFGDAKVYMVSRTLEKAQAAAQNAFRSVKADSVRKNCIPADYSMLKDCIQDSDLVFESVKEDWETKLDITSRIAEYIGDQTICVSGTSGLSLTTLAEQFLPSHRKNYMGMHFFNPPYSLTLCELTPTKYTDGNVFEWMREYAIHTLYRTPVEVKDSPAFLGNRVGFQFINEVMQYAERYKDNGGIDYMDAILGPFTGRSMAPLVTADFVGLDVHKAIVDNIYQNTKDFAHETFVMPQFAQNLVKNGLLGKKTHGGLYKTEILDNGTRYRQVLDISSGQYRKIIPYTFPFAVKMRENLSEGKYKEAFEVLISNQSLEAKICLEFLLKYILYSVVAVKEVGYDIHSADDVMAEGFNWCPPIAMMEALLGSENVCLLMKERLDKQMLEEVDVDSLLKQQVKSKYDYRRYIRAK